MGITGYQLPTGKIATRILVVAPLGCRPQTEGNRCNGRGKAALRTGAVCVGAVGLVYALRTHVREERVTDEHGLDRGADKGIQLKRCYAVTDCAK